MANDGVEAVKCGQGGCFGRRGGGNLAGVGSATTCFGELHGEEAPHGPHFVTAS